MLSVDPSLASDTMGPSPFPSVEPSPGSLLFSGEAFHLFSVCSRVVPYPSRVPPQFSSSS